MNIKQIKKISIFKTLYFNFHFLPFKQAIKLPVIIAPGVKLINGEGKITLSPAAIKFATIRIGFKTYGFQHTKEKTILEIQGYLNLDKNVYIGHGTFINIGKFGTLSINENTTITGNMKIICRENINVGKNTRIAWDVTILDSDFHETVNIHTQERSIVKKKIVIGNNNWIGFGSTIMKGTETPDFCIVGAKSLTNKAYQINNYCLLAGNPAKLIKEGVYRDLSSIIE